MCDKTVFVGSALLPLSGSVVHGGETELLGWGSAACRPGTAQCLKELSTPVAPDGTTGVHDMRGFIESLRSILWRDILGALVSTLWKTDGVTTKRKKKSTKTLTRNLQDLLTPKPQKERNGQIWSSTCKSIFSRGFWPSMLFVYCAFHGEIGM